jgi:hypothetical protein
MPLGDRSTTAGARRFQRFGPLLDAESIGRVMMNAAGSITRMNNHEVTVFLKRSVPRVTSRVRLPSSGYSPNCHTHSKPSAL